MRPRGPLPAPPAGRRRRLGRQVGTAPGPLLILNAGIHGNEPAGVEAAGRVLERLPSLPLRGEVVALAGNLGALDRALRFQDRDLNRMWTPEGVERARRTDDRPAETEEREQRELLSALDEALGRAAEPAFFLDLHTFSAPGPPFVTIGDTLRNRALAWHFPVPVVLGLEEQVDGALLEYLNNLGHVTMGIEGGPHDDPDSVDNHESLLWIALAATGCLEADRVPDLEEHRARLERQTAGRGRFLEVLERRAVVPGNGFRMLPGFRNLQPIVRGELLARTGSGEVRASRHGLLLLPLYQPQGDDGYFVCRRVRTFWLHLSALLRRLRLGGLMHLLPGVRRHASQEGTLIVDTRIAHWFPLEIFHLLGFRKRRRVGNTLVVSRRVHDR